MAKDGQRYKQKEERPLPALVKLGDTHTEQYALTCLLTHAEKVMAVYGERGLTADMFTNAALRKIYEAAEALYNSDRSISAYTVQQLLKEAGEFERVGGTEAFIKLLEARDDIPSSEAAQYADNLINVHKRRAVLTALAEGLELIQRTDRELPAVLGQIGDLVYGSLEGSEGEKTSVPMSEIATRVYQNILHRREHPEEYRTIKSGIDSLDKILGGFMPNGLYIIAARPGKGKTALALSIAHHIVKVVDRTVLFFTMEMSEDEIGNRLMAMEGHINSRLFRNPADLSAYDIEQLPEITARMAELPLIVNGTQNPQITQIRSAIREVKRKAPPGKPLEVVFIDYLQLMSGAAEGGGETNRVQEIGAITRGLKMLASSEKVAVVLLSQLSRAIEKRQGSAGSRPMLSDLRESGSIEQDADVVMFVHREDQTAAEGGPPIGMQDTMPAAVLVQKNRHGETNDAPCMFMAPYMHFVNMITSGNGPIPPTALDEDGSETFI